MKKTVITLRGQTGNYCLPCNESLEEINKQLSRYAIGESKLVRVTSPKENHTLYINPECFPYFEISEIEEGKE